MNCLAVVGRELRVAARKRSTYWLRVGAAGTGLALALGVLILSVQSRTRASEIGGVVFHLLAWIWLTAGTAAGLFLTSDCLSEEKREGTLGLLFLTKLRGYDVVIGKLLATSLRGFFALMAVFPILAITLLAGGVTGEQFWKASLTLMDALLLSLAAGMLISAVSRDSQKALAGTLLILLLLGFGGPIADGIIAGIKKAAFKPFWSLTSPGFTLICASAWRPSPYWTTLLVTHGLAWLMFGAACVLVPYTWQERRRHGTRSAGATGNRWRYGSAGARHRRRRKLLDASPVYWLVTRERWQSRLLWGFVIASGGGLMALLLSRAQREVWMIWIYAGGLFILVLYMAAASQACRFFPAVRRTGFLELLLVTPVGENQLVSGQWRGLWRQFAFPLLLLVAVHVGASALGQLSFQRMVNVAVTPPIATTNSSAAVTNQQSGTVVMTFSTGVGTNAAAAARNLPPLRREHVVIAVITAGSAGLRAVMNLLALCWFGLWMGLTSRNANYATAKTLLFVQVIPWFVITFGTTILLAGIFFQASTGRGSNVAWWPVANAVITAILVLGKDLAFISLSKTQLRVSLREQAAKVPGHPHLSAQIVPVAAPASVAPPTASV